MDLIKKVTAWVLLFVGLGSTILGFVIGGVEAFHILHNVHPFEYPPFIGAGIFIIGGAALIQTKNVNDALSVLIDTLPLVRSIRPGGKRATDPQIEIPDSKDEVKKL